MSAERKLIAAYGWRQWSSMSVKRRHELIKRFGRPGRATGGASPFGDLPDVDAAAFGDAPDSVEQKLHTFADVPPRVERAPSPFGAAPAARVEPNAEFADVPQPPQRPAGLVAAEHPAPDVAPRPAPAAAAIQNAAPAIQDAAPTQRPNLLDRTKFHESGNRDIYSRVDDNGGDAGPEGRSQGFWQISTPTWRDFAPQAGVDLNKYPQAKGTPEEIQRQVASVIPAGRWGNRTLRLLQQDGFTIDRGKTLGENAALNGGDRSLMSYAPADNSSAAPGFVDKAVGVARDAGDAVNNAGQKAGNWFGDNRSWLVPLLSGLGTMASSNSRYLGSAILQGMGGGAQAYAKEQQAQAVLAQTNAGTNNINATANNTNAHTDIAKLQAAGAIINGENILIRYPNGATDWVPLKMWQFARSSYPNARLANASDTKPVDKAPPAPLAGAPSYGPDGVVTGGGSFAPPPAAGWAAKAGASATPVGGAPHYSPPAPPNPVTPISAAPIVSSSWVTPSPEVNKAAALEGPQNSPESKLAGAKFHDDAMRIGQAAYTQAPVLRELALNVLDSGGQKGGGASGAFDAPRMQAIKALQLLDHARGVESSAPNPSDENDLFKKMQATLSGIQAHGLDQNSYAAMQQLASALPGMGFSKHVNAQLMSQLLMINQQQRDKFDMANTYDRATSSMGPARTYGHLPAAYDAQYDPASYLRMQQHLADMLEKRPQLARDMLSGKLNEKQSQTMLSRHKDELGYDPGMGRVFY